MDRRPSPDSGGSEGTTESVFRQFGHMKQFRAHLAGIRPNFTYEYR